jgi:hypothetical protein
MCLALQGVVRTKRKSHHAASNKQNEALSSLLFLYKPEEAARNENFVRSLQVGLYCMFGIN